jgi:hypothetical protein
MADYDDDDEQRGGYFARLERQKSLRRPSLTGGAPAAAGGPAPERAGSLRAVLASRQGSLTADLRAGGRF